MSISKSSQIPFSCSYNFSSIATPFASASAILLTSKSPGIATFSPVDLTCDMKSSVCALNSSKSPNFDGSITTYRSPFVQSFSGEAVPVTLWPYPACTNGPVRISINNDNAYPLNPPNGRIEP